MLAMLLTACVVRATPPPPDRPPTATSPVVPDCPDSGLTFALGVADAAMGLRVQNVTMTNCGVTPYTVLGYPAVQVLDEDRRELDLQVGQGSSGISTVEAFDAPPAEVTLRRGDSATSGLLWRNTVTDTTVPATLGVYLMISPAPGQPWQEVEADPAAHIDLGNTGKLGVQPWTSP